MQGPNFLSKLKNLDAYPKINEDFFTKTMSGGVVTIVASIVMALLFFSELRMYLSTKTIHELVVDTSRGEQISINFDVTFNKMPCSWLSLDAMDISGELHLDVDHDVYKQRLSKEGANIKEAVRHEVESTKVVTVSDNATCLSCYGAEDLEFPCCNTCDDVRNAYRKRGWAVSNSMHIEQCAHDAYQESIEEQKGEGCHMWGVMHINKVAGNFHFAPGRSYQQGNMHVHDIAPFGEEKMDFSHAVHKLSFGEVYPGMKNPLDGATAVTEAEHAAGMYQYFLKVVPTSFKSRGALPIATNQFSVTENYKEGASGPARSLPGVFFFYDLSPIKVKIVEAGSSFMHFLTNMCAIVGGVFTVSGLVDAFIYQGEKIIRKKMEIGKFM